MRREELDALTGDAVDAAVKVHIALGPGLLESAYEACLAFELRSRGHRVLTQVPFPLVYRGVHMDVGYRLDLLVDDAVIIEVKSTARLLPLHEAQLLSYLRLSDRRVGCNAAEAGDADPRGLRRPPAG